MEESVLIENKWQSGTAATPDVIAPSAGIQGRRYAISLMSQIIITAAAYRQDSGKPVSQKTDLIEVRQITKADGNRAEIRFNFPYGAKTPSRDKGS